MFGLKIITQREYDFLISQSAAVEARLLVEQAQYTRLFLLERERADRLIDQVISMSGNEPVGDTYQKEKKSAESKYEAQLAEVAEMYNDQVNEVLGPPKSESPRDPITNLRPEDIDPNDIDDESLSPKVDSSPKNKAS